MASRSPDNTAIYTDRHATIRDKDQAERIAKKRAREHTRHEITVHYDGPGRADVKPRMMLEVSGTGSSLDQGYYIDTVHHHVGDGYAMSVTAKNTRKGRKRA